MTPMPAHTLSSPLPSRWIRHLMPLYLALVGSVLMTSQVRAQAPGNQNNPPVAAEIQLTFSPPLKEEGGEKFIELDPDPEATISVTGTAVPTQGSLSWNTAQWEWDADGQAKVEPSGGTSSTFTFNPPPAGESSETEPSVTVSVYVTPQGEESKLQAQETVKIRRKCKSCEKDCPEGAPGSPQVDSAHFDWNMRSGTALWFHEEAITAASYGPGVLRHHPGAGVSVVRDGSGALRQLRTRQSLTDIMPLTDGRTGYAVKFYLLNQITGQSGGLATVAGSPYLEYAVFNPDATAQGRLKLEYTDRTGSVAVSRSWIFASVAAAGSAPETWSLEEEKGGGSVRKESFTRQSVTGVDGLTRRIEVRQVEEAATGLDSSGVAHQGGALQVVSRVRDTYLVLGTTALLEKQEVGYGTPEVRLSEWTYGTNASQQASYRRRLSEKRPGGAWTTWEYVQGTGADWVEIERTGWLNATFGNHSQCRERRMIYARSGEVFLTWEERVLGQLIRRGWKQRENHPDGTQTRSEHVETPQGVRVTKWTSHPSSAAFPLAGRFKLVENPDGTVVRYEYLADTNPANAGGYLETRDQGAGTAAAVTDGTRMVSKYNAFGRAIETTTIDIASGVALSLETVVLGDDFGRALKTVYDADMDDYTEFVYGCCGVESKRTRDGSVTTFVYDHLKRPIKESRTTGSRTVYTGTTYAGLVRKRWRQVDGVWRVMSESEGNLAGTVNLSRSLAPNGNNWELAETTSVTTAATGGGELRTTTAPDGLVNTDLSYADGQSRTRMAPGLTPVEMTYGTHALNGGGLWSQQTQGGQWTKGYSDKAGQMFRTEQPAFGGGVKMSEQSYDLAGRLIASSTPGQAATLYAYNAKGELQQQALDVNGNGSIDLAGPDRVTESASFVSASVTVGGHTLAPAQVSVSKVYPDGATPVTTSTSYRTPDGLKSASVSLGGLTYSEQPKPVAGAWTTTQVSPVGVTSVAVYEDGLFKENKTFAGGVDPASGLPLSHALQGYDSLERPTTTTERRHTAPGTSSDHVTTVGYNTGGSTISRTTPANETANYTFDVAGRLLTTSLPDSTVQTTEYDPATGQVKKVSGSQAYPVEYGYDGHGRMVTLKTWQDYSGNNGAAVTTWTYDAATGLLTAKTDADGKAVTYTYTTAGQLQTRTWARQSGGQPLTTTYSYHAATGDLTGVDYSDITLDVAYTQDRLGRVLTAGGCTYTYDPTTLQLAAETTSVGLTATTRTLTRSYDTLLRSTGYDLKNGTTVETSAVQIYDAAGRMAAVVHHPHSASPRTFTYGYTAGRPHLLASVSGPAHTVSKTWESQRDVLNQISNEIAGSPVSRYTYTVNALGQRTAVATTGSAFGASPADWTWGYNVKGEVTSATHAGVTSRNATWTFDDIGNRLTQSAGIVPDVTSYTANLLNQYTTVSHPAPSTETPVLDLDGNLIEDANKKYVWDAENRLKQVLRASDDALIASYQYDHLGRRVRKTTTALAPQHTSDTAYSYDAWNVIAEYSIVSGAAFLSRTRTWGMDLSGSRQGAGGVGGLLVDADAVGGGWCPTYDGNGNVSEYLNHAGATAAHYEYDAFGNTVFASGSLSAPAFSCRFSTKVQDVETGWYYYGYRYYDAVQGRWINRDPIGEDGGMNLYGFVMNQPIGIVDQYGMMFNVSYLELWVSNKIDAAFKKLGDGISSSIGEVVDSVGSYYSNKWKSSIGTNFTTSWGVSKSILPPSSPLEISLGGGVSVNGYQDSETCDWCVQVYGTAGATVLGKIPLGVPFVQFVIGGNASAQTTWVECKDHVTNKSYQKWDKFYLVVTPRAGIRVGGDTGTGVAAYGEGGGWLSWSKNLLDASEQAATSGGWYITGSFQLGWYERRFTLSNGSPNF